MKLLACEQCGCERHGMVKKATIVKQTKTTKGTMITKTLCYGCFVEGITGMNWKDFPKEMRGTLMKMARDA